jgi:uncharacterized sulfatase
VLRERDWKLQVTENPRKNWLYDLATDPLEKNNLAESQPERVKAMREKIVAFNATQVKPMWPSLGEAPIPIDKTLKQPQAANDEFVYYSN